MSWKQRQANKHAWSEPKGTAPDIKQQGNASMNVLKTIGATGAMLVGLAASAEAEEMNGKSLNGLTYNAIFTNAITTNAVTSNSLTSNSLTSNGIGLYALNGVEVEGIVLVKAAAKGAQKATIGSNRRGLPAVQRQSVGRGERSLPAVQKNGGGKK
jgi:hypothetical protein